MRDDRLDYAGPHPGESASPRPSSATAAVLVVMSFLCLLAPIYGVMVRDVASIWTGLLIALFGFFIGGVGLVVGWRCGGWIVAGGILAVVLHVILVFMAVRFAFGGIRVPVVF